MEDAKLRCSDPLTPEQPSLADVALRRLLLSITLLSYSPILRAVMAGAGAAAAVCGNPVLLLATLRPVAGAEYGAGAECERGAGV